MGYTVAVVNHLLQSGRWIGRFATREEADAYIAREAARSRTFMEYRVCVGTPEQPGQDVGPAHKGTR